MSNSTPFDFQKLVENLNLESFKNEDNPYAPPKFNEEDIKAFVVKLCNFLEAEEILPAQPLILAVMMTCALYIVTQSETRLQAIQMLEYYIKALTLGVVSYLPSKES